MFRVGCCFTISCRPKVAKRRLGCVWGRALFVGVNSTHEKRPVGNRRSDGIRSKTNRTMIVWSRLVKASVSNGERGFARSVPVQGSWRAF